MNELKPQKSVKPISAAVALACCLSVPLGFSTAALAADAPASKNALFGDDDDKPTAKPEVKGEAAAAADTSAPEAEKPKSASNPSNFKGFTQFEFARSLERPIHWTKMLNRTEASTQGTLGEGLKYKLSGRVEYDAVFDAKDFYSAEVKKDQRYNFSLRENYLDVNAGDWDFRLGRQHVIWGEMVGLFFADVVSARNMREFILPEFDVLRIPQWAVRAEYFKDDFHAELLWIPTPTFDETGKPGSEFFPLQPTYPGMSTQYRTEVKPATGLNRSNYGARVSWLKNGWDVAAFVYRSMDASPTFYREVNLGTNTVTYEGRHDRISQIGGTLAKDFGSMVLKGEAVYTKGRQFTVLRLSDDDGVVRQNTLDWVLGLEFALPAETRFNVQLFQTVMFNHDADLIQKKYESGYSLLLNAKLMPQMEGEVVVISSLNRNDWLLRPRVKWNFEKNWRLMVGVDKFEGSPSGVFGRYDRQDRAYTELRYSF